MVGHHNVTIQSDSIESSWQIFELTIRDVTRPVTFDVELEGIGVDGKGGQHLGASAAITIDRKDFGLVWNQPVQNGVLVGDKVKVDVGLEALDAASAKAMGIAA